jgi:hypothetical protein
MTEKEREYFDKKFDPLNKAVLKIDLVLSGYDGKGGYLDKVDILEKTHKKFDDRLKRIESKKISKQENKKAIIAVLLALLGSGGIITTIFINIFSGGP